MFYSFYTCCPSATLFFYCGEFFSPPLIGILFIQLLYFTFYHIYLPIYVSTFVLLTILMASIHGPLSETCCCYGPALPSLSSACLLQPASPEHVPINRVLPILRSRLLVHKNATTVPLAQPVGSSEPGSMSDHG